MFYCDVFEYYSQVPLGGLHVNIVYYTRMNIEIYLPKIDTWYTTVGVQENFLQEEKENW